VYIYIGTLEKPNTFGVTSYLVHQSCLIDKKKEVHYRGHLSTILLSVSVETLDVSADHKSQSHDYMTASICLLTLPLANDN